MRKLLFALFIHSLLFSLPLFGITKLNFYELSLREGLSHTSVHDICRDSKGVLWIGTSFGLNRYDGYEMRQYFNTVNDSTSLPGNQIFFVHEDKQANLWVGTNHSVALYNRERDNFETAIAFQSLPFKSCYSLDDRILFFEADRMVSYFYDERRFETTHFPPTIGKIPLSVKIAPLGKDKLLIATRWRGIFSYHLTTGEIVVEPFHKSPQITAICVDKEGIIWLSSYGDGLFAYQSDGTLLAHYTSENSALSYNVILDLQVASNGELWIATDGNGISILDKAHCFHNFSYAPNNPENLPVTSVSKIYEDEFQNIWIGTVRGGVLGTKRNFIRSYTQGATYGLSERTVLSFYEDEKGFIWVGTDGNGINRFNPDSETFQHYPATYQKKVTSIVRYSTDELLLSYFGEGLRLFNTQTGAISPSPLGSKNLKKDKKYGWISTNLRNINKDSILIMGEQLHLYTISNNEIESLATWSKDSLEGGLNFICAADSLIYLYSPTKIFKVNLATKKIDNLTNMYKRIGVRANAVVRASDTNFWIASEKGIWNYNLVADQYYLEGANEFKLLSAMVVAKDSSLWLGAANKVYCCDTDKWNFSEYDISDGVAPNIYLAKAVHAARSGDLYLGGANGFQRIITKDRELESTKGVVEPIELILNGEFLTGFSSTTSREIVLPPTNQTIDVRFMVRTKSLLNQKSIRYKLEGVMDDFVSTVDPTIRFTKLLPGTYQLLVEVAANEIVGNHTQQLLTFYVSPFWWQTWWFKFVLTILLVLILFSAWNYYRRKQQKEMQLKISRSERELSEQKVRFLINVNHELRTPLTLISAPLERLLRDHPDFTDEVKRPLLGIYKQTKQMRSVIDMVLDFRKMELNPNELKLSSFDFVSFLQEIIGDYQLEYAAQEISFKFLPLPIEMLPVRLDRDKCRKIINNLLMNALKFSTAGGEVSVGVELQGEEFILRVIDSGMGLSGADIDKLFTRFYQANHNLGGSGIGLSYSKSLAEMMGGTMGCSSNETIGATFWLKMPLKIDVELGTDFVDDELSVVKDEGYILTHPPKDYSLLKEYTILIVEDELDLNSYLKKEMACYFKKVYSARNGKEGVALALERMPDCIISDVMMPEMNGYELCHQLKSTIELSHVPIVLLTARTDDESMQYGYEVGADGYLAKPFSLEAVLNLTSNILNMRLKMQEHFRNSGYTLLPEEISCNNEEEQFLTKLLKIIDEELSNPELDVDMLADRMAVSRSTLYAKMKSISGSGVKDFINEIRIKKAMVLLRETKLPIVEVSERVGYSQQRYFSTVFKQYNQMTPTQYRQHKEL